jgi:RNA polymerase sigma factor (sigma-70 family)
MDETKTARRFIPRRGPLDAFQRQLIDLLPRLRRFARTLVTAPADADDLVQTTVERALARRDQWREGTRLDWWTMRILKNAWIDQGRSSQRRGQVVDFAEAAEFLADPTQAGEADRVGAMAVAQAMSRLPEDQRVAVALVLVEGFSYAEAADLLSIPPGTLNSRLVRGRTALMEMLAEKGPS